MSAFARTPATSLLVCVFRPHAPRQAANLSLPRTFRSLAPLRAAKKPQRPVLSGTKPAPKQAPAKKAAPARTAPAAPAATTTTTTTGPPATAYAYIKQLAARGAPTTLYEAPSHAWMKFGSWSTAIFCFSYAGYTITFYTNPPAGLAWWVGPAYCAISVAFALVGTAFLLRTNGIVKSIRAIPAEPASQLARVNLEVAVKSTLPLVKPRLMVVPVADVALKSRIVAPAEFLTRTEEAERKREEARRKEEKRKYEMAHLFSAPFRHAARGARSAFRGAAQLFTGTGFGTLKVGGSTYRLDVTNAWMLDEGKALDRLVKVVGVDGTAEPKWSKLYQ